MKSLILSIFILFGGTLMTNAQDNIQRPSSYNYTMGVDLAHEGKTSEALESFEKELKDNPKNGYAYSWIGAIYIKLEEYGSALSAIKNSLKYLPAKDENFVANSYKALSTVYLNVQDTLQAYTTLGDGLKAYPDNEDLLETRAQLYFEQSRYEESNKDYQHMIDVNPGNEMGYMGIGRNLKMQKKYSEAIAVFDKVTKLSPNYSSGYAFRAECLFAQKKYEAAIVDVITALSVDINDRKAIHHLIELSDSVYEDVIAHLKAGKGQNPPEWLGMYFEDSASKWFKAYQNDVVSSSIDLWKGCISVVGEEFDGAIVTKEYPIYQMLTDEILPEFLAALFRTRYYRRAFRAITTGHSNRRRTQTVDFEAIDVCYPQDKQMQRRLIQDITSAKQQQQVAIDNLNRAMSTLSNVIDGREDDFFDEDIDEVE